MSWLNRNTICGAARMTAMVVASVVWSCAALQPAAAAGDHGGGGHGRVHIHGGSPGDRSPAGFGGYGGNRQGFEGEPGRQFGSGFGYNGGYYGQGVYAPYGGTPGCLRRVFTENGRDVVRVC